MTHRLEDVGEALRMVRFLAEVGYRDLARNANQQRLALSRRLSRDGVNEPILRLLWNYAGACGESQEGLFCHWLGSPARTLAKIEEMRSKSAWLEKAATQQQEARPPIEAVIHQLSRKMQA